MGLYADGSADPILLLGIHSYVTMLPTGDLVAWRWHADDGDPSTRSKHLAFQHFPLDSLQAFKPPKRGEELEKDRVQWAWTAEPPSAPWLLPVDLWPGEHELVFPEWLSPFNELLVLLDQNAKGGRAIASLLPRLGRLTILPLTWFNEGNYDVGYEWVTRVARHSSGDIVGDGIRMKPFRLDSSGATLKKWLGSSLIP